MWNLSPLSSGCATGDTEELALAATMEETPPKPEWKAVKDDGTGRLYYFHRLTKKTTWTKPEKFDEQRKAYKSWKKTISDDRHDDQHIAATAIGEPPAVPAPFDEAEGPKQEPAIEPVAEKTKEDETPAVKSDATFASDAAIRHDPYAPDLDEGSLGSSLALSRSSPLRPKEEQEVVIASSPIPECAEEDEVEDLPSPKKTKGRSNTSVNWDSRPKPQAVVFPTHSKKRSVKQSKKSSKKTLSKRSVLPPEKELLTKPQNEKSSRNAVMYHPLPETNPYPEDMKEGKRRRKTRRSLSPNALRPSHSKHKFRTFPLDEPNSPTAKKPAAITKVLPDVRKSKKKLLSSKKKDHVDAAPELSHAIESKPDKNVEELPVLPPQIKRSVLPKKRRQEDIPRKVQVPISQNKRFLKRRFTSWNACYKDDPVGDDGASHDTPSTLSQSSCDSIDSEEERESPKEHVSGWETLCSRHLWKMCAIVDPSEDGWVCNRAHYFE